MDTSYATYIYIHMPSAEYIAPADIFTGTRFLLHNMKDIHIRIFPVYVLDPTLQKSFKLPKLQPQYYRGVFAGFSTNHSSGIPLIINPATVHISPQFHVIFHYSFIRLLSVSPE